MVPAEIGPPWKKYRQYTHLHIAAGILRALHCLHRPKHQGEFVIASDKWHLVRKSFFINIVTNIINYRKHGCKG